MIELLFKLQVLQFAGTIAFTIVIVPYTFLGAVTPVSWALLLFNWYVSLYLNPAARDLINKWRG